MVATALRSVCILLLVCGCSTSEKAVTRKLTNGDFKYWELTSIRMFNGEVMQVSEGTIFKKFGADGSFLELVYDNGEVYDANKREQFPVPNTWSYVNPKKIVLDGSELELVKLSENTLVYDIGGEVYCFRKSGEPGVTHFILHD